MAGSWRVGLVALTTATMIGAAIVPVLAGERTAEQGVGDTWTRRLSVSSAEQEGNREASPFSGPAITPDGRFVAFVSRANNLVANDTNMSDDVFVRDRQTGETERVSVGIKGEVNVASSQPSISADGRFVAFTSRAPQLVPGDTNRARDAFVRDRLTGTTERVSVNSDEQQADQGVGAYWPTSMSATGRFVVFTSTSTNLVSEDTNHTYDVFIRDRSNGTTQRVSVDSNGVEGANYSGPSGLAISGNGQYVVFGSHANNLAPGDDNKKLDVFLWERLTGTTTRISVSSDEIQGNKSSSVPAISAGGRYVSFASYASNLVADDTNGASDVFVRDTQTGETTRISVNSNGVQGNRGSVESAISGNGEFVAFESNASNFSGNDVGAVRNSDVFVHELATGMTRRISVAIDDQRPDGESFNPVITASGALIAFSSEATNLINNDTNGLLDVFVRRW